MKTNALFSIIFLFTAQVLNAQTGRITTTIKFDSIVRTLHYYIPGNYNPSNQHRLVLGLHGCDTTVNNPGEIFRNQIEFLADRLNAVVVCPEGLRSEYGFMGAEPSFVLAVIDSAMTDYKIDQQFVYMTGFSCNGYTTTAFGTHKIFPFRGILPFNPAYVESDFSDGSFIYTTHVPTCICAGTEDPGYNLDLRLRDSLLANKAPLLFNEMHGIGHTTDFPTFQDEVMECFNYFSDITSVFENNAVIDLQLQTYPNPATEHVTIKCSKKMYSLELYSNKGEQMREIGVLNQDIYKLDLSGLSPGIYIIKINYQNGLYYRKKIVVL